MLYLSVIVSKRYKYFVGCDVSDKVLYIFNQFRSRIVLCSFERFFVTVSRALAILGFFFFDSFYIVVSTVGLRKCIEGLVLLFWVCIVLVGITLLIRAVSC